jgi:pyrroloquinoline quinone biosynthesis protein E
MPPPRPYTLVAELSYQCPLHCPYCSNPVDIGGERWRAELETEHWIEFSARLGGSASSSLR